MTDDQNPSEHDAAGGANAVADLESDDPSLHDPALTAHPAKKLPRATQIVAVAAGAGLLVVWLVLGSLLHTGAAETAPTASTGSFKPNAEQWAGFKTAEVMSRPFFTTELAPGKVAIDDDLTTAVYSPYSGRVTKLFARAGDDVVAGQKLFAMQASEFVQGANDLVNALATDRTTKAQLVVAATNETRQHKLYLIHGAALKDWQQSQSDLAGARGSFASAEVALGAVRNRLRILGKSDLEVAQMETAIDPSRFSSEAMVPAPISGTVEQRQVGVGQNIVTLNNGGATPLYTIGDTSRVWLVANVPEMDAPNVHLGDTAEVRVLAVPGRVYKAKVTYVAVGLDPVTHRLPIHAEIDNSDRLLKPEMFASFRIVGGEGSEAPAVDKAALVYDDNGAHVWLVGPDKTLTIRPIRTGREDGDSVEVLDGLRPGDVVVTSGSVFIDRAAEAN